MQAKVLKTDFADQHAPQDWGMATAERIFEILPNTPPEHLFLAKRKQIEIAECLAAHHEAASHTERGRLAENAPTRLKMQAHDHSAEVLPFAAEVAKEIQAILQGTRWEDKYNDPATLQAVTLTIASDIMTNHDLERQAAANKGAK